MKIAIASVVSALALLSTTAHAEHQPGAIVATYEASSGLLPDELCWSGAGIHFASPPNVMHGALHLGPTSNHAATYYLRSIEPFSFNDGAAIEATTLILASDYIEDGAFQWTGYSIGIHDSDGGFARLGVADDRILLQTSEDGLDDQTFPFTSTDGYHTYRLEITNGLATVSVDGVAVLWDTIGSGRLTNAVTFGDSAIIATSESSTASVRVEAALAFALADFDHDGSVGSSDLAELLGAWGTSSCIADLTGDGIVDGQDLSALIGAWGS